MPELFFSTKYGVFALRIGYHEMGEDVGDEIRKLAFSDGSSNITPRLVKPAHSKSVFYVFVLMTIGSYDHFFQPSQDSAIGCTSINH